MPVGRVILKSISDSQKLPRLKTDGARLLYTWLLTHLDVNGCFSGDPEIIKGKVFTRLKKSIKTVEVYLQDLEENKLIIRYVANGDIFLHVPDFVEKQPHINPEREGRPTIPLPTPELLKTYSGPTPTLSKSKDKSKVESKSKEETTKSPPLKEFLEKVEEPSKTWLQAIYQIPNFPILPSHTLEYFKEKLKHYSQEIISSALESFVDKKLYGEKLTASPLGQLTTYIKNEHKWRQEKVKAKEDIWAQAEKELREEGEIP